MSCFSYTHTSCDITFTYWIEKLLCARVGNGRLGKKRVRAEVRVAGRHRTDATYLHFYFTISVSQDLTCTYTCIKPDEDCLE